MAYGGNEDGGLNFALAPRLTCGRRRNGSCRSARPTAARSTRSSTSPLCLAAARNLRRPLYLRPLDRSTYSAQVRVNYTFKPDLNLDFYGEPFAASGRYDSVGELAAAREPRSPADVPRPAAVRATSRAVLPQQSGAALGVAARQISIWCGSRTARRTRSTRRRPRSAICSALGARGDHFFAVKMSLWLSR